MNSRNESSLISIVIPVFRNEGSLEILHTQLVQQFTEALPKLRYEIIFVDDGSDDGSLEKILKCREKDSNVKALSFSRNFGQMAAIIAGWKLAKGDAVINMAADLQDPPEQVSAMVYEWQNGSDIVICHREARKDAWINVITSKFFYWLMKFSVSRLPPGGFDIALLDRKVMQELRRFRERNRFFQGEILWMGFKTSFIPYARRERIHGVSQYNFRKRFGNFSVAFLNASYLPIRAMSLLGIMTAFLGFLYMLTVFYAYFVGSTPFSGWAPLMVVILIIGGTIMMMLGIIGEYVWRVYDEVKRRPQYIVDKKYL